MLPSVHMQLFQLGSVKVESIKQISHLHVKWKILQEKLGHGIKMRFL